MTKELRKWIRLVENVSPQVLAAQKDKWLPGLIQVMASRSVAAVLEMSYDDDEEELASAWFDNCLRIYDYIIKQGSATIYRHMMVEDFEQYVGSLQNGSGRLGEYWSINYGMESPTWKQDQRGSIPVIIQGRIDLSQIDWEKTLLQNFEWPHESEIIITGDVFVQTIENLDEDETVELNKKLRRSKSNIRS